MANQYSVEIHRYISEKIAAAEKNKVRAQKQENRPSERYYAGQLLELTKIREYMAARIDLKTQKYY
ncbi:MAG: hypothetical protein HKO68_03745 [Desulfobacterales bacterium]|nr:hypothetical protein [Desulfobacterales bacterium]